jgi:hypothetical protein
MVRLSRTWETAHRPVAIFGFRQNNVLVSEVGVPASPGDISGDIHLYIERADFRGGRGLTNERGDFLMSTLPVIDPTVAPNTGMAVVPHFVDGGVGSRRFFL